MVSWKPAIIPGSLISRCGRFTIKPNPAGNQWGWKLNDIKTGYATEGAAIAVLKRIADRIKEGR
jgi:hypothetical protein